MRDDLDTFQRSVHEPKSGHSYSNQKGYDIIGDIHGCGDTLIILLLKLGYQHEDGCYRHPTRKAVFVGDIIDRGPHILEALAVVKAMVDNGAALCILGNHEINALAYTTQRPVTNAENSLHREFVRPHNARNNRQISETLTQFAAYPELWRTYLDWFMTLPLYLELDGMRVVHACWDDNVVNRLIKEHSGPYIDKAFLIATCDYASFEARAIDTLTRGTDLPLPNKRKMTGSDGLTRGFFRTKFWARNPKSFKDVVFQPDPLPDDLLDYPLDESHTRHLLEYGGHEPPVFVGHYWLQGKPKPIKDNIACVDYSAVKYGRMVAYRYSGEQTLNEDHFEWVYVDP